MTADRRDWVEVGCECGWGIRGPEFTVRRSLENHLCPLRASVSPSNATKHSGGHPGYLKVVEERTALHIEKSGGYGTGKDPFANFTAVAELTGMPRWVYPMLRAEEKIQRCWSLYKQDRTDELEEEFIDISSLFDCATAMLREDLETDRQIESGEYL